MKGTYLRVNGVRLHVVQDGPDHGRLVLLLHGFPEFWYGWRHQIPALADRGFRVWAPDQRGYNLSEKPSGLDAYTRDQLAADAAGLIAASGRERAVVVGHDWGAAVAWRLAGKHPELVDRLVIINVPHPQVFRQHLRTNLGQLLRSWYVFAFQLPGLPEALARWKDWRPLTRALTRTSLPGTFSEEDLARYREAWSRPGAYPAMLNWYRAAVRRPSPPLEDPVIQPPTLVIWGSRDRFLDPALAEPSAGMCRDGRLEIFPEATHWVIHEQPDRVNRLILEHVTEEGRTGRINPSRERQL